VRSHFAEQSDYDPQVVVGASGVRLSINEELIIQVFWISNFQGDRLMLENVGTWISTPTLPGMPSPHRPHPELSISFPSMGVVELKVENWKILGCSVGRKIKQSAVDLVIVLLFTISYFEVSFFDLF
jgi:hypothetical protein